MNEKQPLTDYRHAGVDYDWLACDAEGNLAIFSNAGVAEMPRMLTDDSYLYHNDMGPLLDVIYDDLPVMTGFFDEMERRHCQAEETDGNLLKEAASKGVFVFDADFSASGGQSRYDKTLKIPYRKVYTPNQSINISQFSAEAAEAFAKFRLSTKFMNHDFFSENEVLSLRY